MPTYTGDSGNNVMTGTTGDDSFYGLGGNDTMTDDLGNDFFDGGTGDDTMGGGRNNDTYVYLSGDGNDVIDDDDHVDDDGAGAAIDVLSFGSGITLSTIVFSRVTDNWNSMTVSFTNQSGSIKLDNQWSVDSGVERMVIAGVTYTHAQVAEFYIDDQTTTGNDIIWGTNFNDVVDGDAGNDGINTGDGNDTLDGGAGDDTLEGARGNDAYVHTYGVGNDVVTDQDFLFDWDTNDTLTFGSGITLSNMVFERVDTNFFSLKISYTGQSGSVTIFNQHSNDYGVETFVINGATYTDDQIAEIYVDRHETTGNDTIWGTNFADVVTGLAGNDTIATGENHDTLTGGTGDDLLIGDEGEDTYIYALGDGADSIDDHNPPYDDYDETDTLVFGTGITLANMVFSRVETNGNDLLISFTGQSGSVLIQNQHLWTWGIEEFVIDGDTYTDEAIAIIYVDRQETTGNDVVWGTQFADDASGGAGNDEIVAGEGNDILTGGTGNDVLQGMDGADSYVFARGDGNDVVTDNSLWNDTDEVSFAAGIAETQVTVGKTADGASYILYLDGGGESLTLTGTVTWGSHYVIEQVRFASGATWTSSSLAARFYGATNNGETIIGTANVDTIHGLGGDDQIEGRADNDILFGDDGADVLLGEDGNDTLDGGAGSDQLTGGAGNDIYYVDVSGDTVTEASGGGTDLVYSKVTRTLGAEIENLTLYGGATINGTGNSLANTITGNNAANTLNGGSGADTMSGGDNHDIYIVDNVGDVVIESGSNGNDKVETSVTYTLPTHFEKLTLTGSANIDGTANGADNILTGNSGDNYLSAGSGDDTVTAGDGDDVIYGSGGDDVLTGGAGDDQFRFTVAPGTGNVDDITDFSVVDDRIFMARYAFTAFEGVSSFTSAHYRAGTAAADATDRVIYDSATGNIYYDADGTGATAQILFATVDPGTSLTYADFGIYG